MTGKNTHTVVCAFVSRPLVEDVVGVQKGYTDGNWSPGMGYHTYYQLDLRLTVG